MKADLSPLMNVENYMQITPNQHDTLDNSDENLLRSLNRNLATGKSDNSVSYTKFKDSGLNIKSPIRRANKKENYQVRAVSIGRERKKQSTILKNNFSSKVFVPKQSCLQERRLTKSHPVKPVNYIPKDLPSLAQSELITTPCEASECPI